MKVLSALLTIACVALTYGLDEPAPVERVVTLLEQLKERLESDGTTEQAAFDKFGCWCETTTSKKAADIVALKQRLQTLGNSILQLKGSLATYAAELAQLAADIEENEKAQATATAIREKEHAAFLAEKSELEQAIAALEGAIKVLKSATSASLRQTKSSLASSNDSPNAILLTKVRSALSHLPSRAGQVHRTQLLSVEQKLAAGNSAGYAPQSATIQGILQEMYESFSSTLQSEIAAEGTLQRNFESLMATYQTELATLKTAVIKKEKQKAEAEVMLAEAETAFDESTEQLAADTDYFDITKASCKAKAEEWSERKTLRAEELQGISEALTILSSDAAKDLFAKAIQPGVGGASTGKMFLQVAESHGHAGGVDTAKKVLKASAKKTQSLRVAAISAEVSALSGKDVGHFEKVFLAIDKLLVQLQEEQAADEEKVATCKEQYVKLNSSLEDLSWKLTNNEANIDKLGLLVEAKTQEKTTVIAEIQNMEAEITSMKEERVAENAEYLAAKKDDEEAIALLEQAKDALAKYFKNNDIELGPLELGRAMLQIEGLEPNETAPEATFSDKASRKGESKGIIALLANIIEDLQSELRDSKTAEEAAQVAYEKQLAAAETVLEELTNGKLSLEEFIALRNQDITDEETKLGQNQQEAESEEKTLSEIKPNCDFIISRLSERTRKRDAERDGLKTAREYLAGAVPSSLGGSFLQQRRATIKLHGRGA